MRGDTRCIDGRLFRHEPQRDDPEFECDAGPCPEGEGFGCDEYESIMNQLITSEEMTAQALRCGCRGVDDLCVCQNATDKITRRELLFRATERS